MIATIALSFLTICYLAVGCAVAFFAFVEEWRLHPSPWVSIWLVSQMILLAFFWPFAVASIFIYAAVDR